LQIARNASASGQPAWLYLFTRVRPGMDSIRAYHGAEIPYVFDTADEWLPRDETDRKLTDAMTSYWVNFVTSGDPNGRDLPKWPQASAHETNALELGDTIRPADLEEYAICAMIDR
jgi:para-nitrobenzyl esterase